MFKRLLFITSACIIIAASAAQASAENASPAPETALLQYKFTQGELLRYQVVMDISMKMDMPGAPDSAAMGNIPSSRTVMVLRQRAVKLLPGGDAEINMAIESMSITFGGQSINYPAEKLPVFTLVTSPSGEIKDINVKGGVKGIDVNKLVNSWQNNVSFPANPIKVGDTWAQTLPLPLPSGRGTIQADNQLTALNIKQGGYTVAAIKQTLGGDFTYNMAVPSGKSNSKTMNMKGTVSGGGIIYFSPECGRLVQSEGTMLMQTSVNMSAEQAKSMPGPITMTSTSKYTMTLMANQ
ncbi:MAG TPA: hypothetical protein DCL60_06670 [Armatimonadetes bacterium]|jgi:hypothetical protein|nr:hypothetical protein [Armatimonadota bacterium]